MFWGSPVCLGTPSPAVLQGCPPFHCLRFETCRSRWVLARLQAGGTREFPPPRDAGRQLQAHGAHDPPVLRCWVPGKSLWRRVPPARKSLGTGPEPGFPVPPQAPLPTRKGPCAGTRAPRPRPTPARQAAAGHWARADAAQAAGVRAGLTRPPEGRRHGHRGHRARTRSGPWPCGGPLRARPRLARREALT